MLFRSIEEAPEASTSLPVEPTEEVTEEEGSDHSTPTSKHQSLAPSRIPSPVGHYNAGSRAATPVSPVSPAAAAPVAHAPTPVYHIPIIVQQQPVIMSTQASTTITGMQGAVPAAVKSIVT